MARQELVRIIDDFDGKPIEDEEPIVCEFTVEGVEYALDLRPSNVVKWQADMNKWVSKATKVGGRKKRRMVAAAEPTKAEKKQELADIRNWARDNGYNVSEKGRVSAEIREAYEEAML